ncbi:Cyclic nucleotide-binding domain [Phytophthora infestans]|uniref:Cyclic nucleotide-binding domain n=1 Tax=Phytophthora infestans TaxID=4787 RepID=A0A833TCZ4_PHYIN|nr:Cyclic nucleotide-binding domain [Phytophthora infestans]
MFVLSKRASWREQPSHELPEVRANLRRILLLSEVARCKAEYEFLDNYIQNVKYFRELPPRDRLRFLKAAKGIELDDGDALFRVGDRADAFYCIMFGTMSVVMDFSRMAAPTLNEFEEIMNRARVHSSFLNPGGKLDMSHDATYVVRTMKPLEVFGDVGLLLEEQQRTASVVATETTLLMQIDRDTFMALRARNLSRELREKMAFLAGVACLDHWEDEGILKLCDRMEKIQHTYNDVVVAEGEPSNHFYFIKQGECRLVKRYSALEQKHIHQGRKQPCFVEISPISSQHYFGFYEAIMCVPNAVFSVLVSSPTAILYRVDRVDFRQIVLKDATTEQLLRQEAIGLTACADTTSVMRDLKRETKWSQYKKDLVDSVLSRHEEEHIPIMGPRPDLGGYHSAREPKFCLPKLPTSPASARGSQTEREVPGVSSGRLRRAQKPLSDYPKASPRRSRGHDGSWLDWAQQRARSGDSTSSGRADKNEQGLMSNVQWGKTSQIMGKLRNDEDKVSTAIVDLFKKKGEH